MYFHITKDIIYMITYENQYIPKYKYNINTGL